MQKNASISFGRRALLGIHKPLGLCTICNTSKSASCVVNAYVGAFVQCVSPNNVGLVRTPFEWLLGVHGSGVGG
jgi:hypothetical protein